MKGRKPTPTVLRILRGNPQRRPLNRDEPQYGALAVAVPPELIDPESVAEWNRTIVPAIESGQIRETHRALAIAHCELWATWRMQLAEARTHPMIVSTGGKTRKLPDGTVETKAGHPIPNPAQGMANTTLKILKSVDSEMALTCTAQARVKVPSGKKSSLEQFEQKFGGQKRV